MVRRISSVIVLTLSAIVAPSAAHAQRVEFPSTAPPPDAFPSPAAAYGSSIQPPPPPTFDPYALPSNTPQMNAPYLPPSTGTYGAPAPYSPYTAAPYSGSPAALYPEGTPVYTGQGFAPIGNAWTQTVRFLQEVHVDETWLSRGGGSDALGINTINAWSAFAIPFYWSENPLLITPGFQLYLWDGPSESGATPASLPAQTYGAYLDFAWNPQINNWLGAELEVSPGVYTDFAHTTNQSIRILGRGLGVITFSPTMQFKLGIWYLDRLKVKILPAGGIVWTPNPDARYEIFFPAPKLARRCTTLGNHDLWAYIRGEYGGGSWTAERTDGGTTFNDQFDYNDLRFAVGLDILPETQSRLRGYLEVGFAWDRELVYRSGAPSQYNLSDTLLLGGGLSY